MSTLPPEGENGAPQQPDQAPEATAPEAPQVPPMAPPVAPQAPAAPQYGAPQPGYGAPQPEYGAPHPGYQQVPVADPLSNLTLNYWLSVFFTWIPALIFYITEKDKGNPHVRALHAANLNFSLLRTAVGAVGWILVIIPVLGVLLWWAANIVLLVFHIMAAAKVADTYKQGGADPFIFNVPLVK